MELGDRPSVHILDVLVVQRIKTRSSISKGFIVRSDVVSKRLDLGQKFKLGFGNLFPGRLDGVVDGLLFLAG